jgi:hypothetical protein
LARKPLAVLRAAADEELRRTVARAVQRQVPTVGPEAQSDAWVRRELAKMASASHLVEAQRDATLGEEPRLDVEPALLARRQVTLWLRQVLPARKLESVEAQQALEPELLRQALARLVLRAQPQRQESQPRELETRLEEQQAQPGPAAVLALERAAVLLLALLVWLSLRARQRRPEFFCELLPRRLPG